MYVTTHSARIILASTFLAACLVGAACSDDTEPAAAEVSQVSTAASSDPDHPYCEVERQIDAHFATVFSALGEDATEQEQMAAVETAAKAVVTAGLLEEAESTAPDAIRADLDLLMANVRAAADGNVAVFFTSESDAAGSRVDAFCGLSD
jgi:hypothetical protein